MKITKAKDRDKKRRKARYGHTVGSKSVFVIQGEQVKRNKKRKERKNDRET
jgi:hypothetical protein